MDAHATHAVEAAAAHDHPGPGTYLKIGLVLFVLTGLEVGAYELAHRGGTTEQVLGPVVVPILLILSALKFALVAGYYMHLKNDHRVFTGLFLSGLIIATVVIVALMLLMSYHLNYNQGLV
jgi:caa(3)-type oxidase subunit IV